MLIPTFYAETSAVPEKQAELISNGCPMRPARSLNPPIFWFPARALPHHSRAERRRYGHQPQQGLDGELVAAHGLRKAEIHKSPCDDYHWQNKRRTDATEEQRAPDRHPNGQSDARPAKLKQNNSHRPACVVAYRIDRTNPHSSEDDHRQHVPQAELKPSCHAVNCTRFGRWL